MDTFDKGDLVRVTGTFTNAAGTVLDPTMVGFKFQVDGGTVTTYVYGTDAQLVKDSTGVYHVDLSCSSVGTFHVRFYSTGTGQGALDGSFYVQGSRMG